MQSLTCHSHQLNTLAIELEYPVLYTRFQGIGRLGKKILSPYTIYGCGFVDYLSHLGRGLYNVVYNLCPIPLSFCNKICLIYGCGWNYWVFVGLTGYFFLCCIRCQMFSPRFSLLSDPGRVCLCKRYGGC